MKIRELLDAKGVTAYRMAVDLGFPQSTVSEWLSGVYVPKADKLLKIAKYLDVPVEELIKAHLSETKSQSGKGSRNIAMVKP